jgi:peroxiredoxin
MMRKLTIVSKIKHNNFRKGMSAMNSRILFMSGLVLALSLVMIGCKKSDEPAESKTPESPVKITQITRTATESGDDLTKTAGKVQEQVTKAAESGTEAIVETAAALGYSFTLADQGGKNVSLADYAGKIVVLEWINPDCPFVVRHYQAKTMINLALEYKERGVVWLAVNTTKTYDMQKNQAFHEAQALPYPVLNDRTGVVGKLFEAKTTPHMYIIDAQGQLAYQGAIDDDPQGTKGADATNYVKQALDELLAGKAVSMAQTKPYGCSVKYAN